jgi:hypothetical protein
MEPVGEHPVPVGPLAVRWLAVALPPFRAGTRATARVRLRNVGSAPWRSRGPEKGINASYHWLDPLGNAIDWDGIREPFPHPVAPGEEVELELTVLAPRAPGRYRLALDLVEEFRWWFAEVGSHALSLDAEVLPRIEARRLAVVVHGGEDRATAAALAAQEEPLVGDDAAAIAHLVPGAEPAPDWSRRVLDAHEQGFAAVGGAIESRDRALRPWAPAGGRDPGFEHPLLLPSLLRGLEPEEHLGLPAHRPGEDAWLYDGRIRLRLRRGRRRA